MQSFLRDLFQYHTTHHRGQIVAAVRQVGGEPFASDFIFFARQEMG